MRSISGVVKPLADQALYLSVIVVALAQLAEHRIVAPKVTGSSPVGHPTMSRTILTLCGGREGDDVAD
jgi:hypothetical protein